MTVNGPPVVTFNKVGSAAAAGLGLVSTLVGAARKEISQGLLVRVLTDWDIGEVELHAVFPSRKAAKPSARALDLLPSSAVMIFPSRSQLRSEFPLGTTAMALMRAPPRRVKSANRSQLLLKSRKIRVRRIQQDQRTAGISRATEYDFSRLERDRACGARRAWSADFKPKPHAGV
ncbi:hypothetical protein ACVWVY_008043 [Bradyrhizobium sp. URHC0002]